jgi:hypothetical protein
MAQTRYLQTSRSRYNSPIFVVKKKDGFFRLVQDFRALNQQTYIDKYSMRDVSYCIHEIGKSESTIFSTIDLTSGFWQMVLEPNSRPLTAFTVYGMGQYEFTTSPMGLLVRKMPLCTKRCGIFRIQAHPERSVTRHRQSQSPARQSTADQRSSGTTIPGPL